MNHEAHTAPCRITWWGHSSVCIELDGLQFVTDPLLRRRVGPLWSVGYRPTRAEIDATDVVLLSHLHRDHTDLRSLSQFPARTLILVPEGAAEMVRPRVAARVEEIGVDRSTVVGTVTIRATFADHDGRRRYGGPDAVAVGHLLLGSRTLYAAGDTDLFPGMSDVRTHAGEPGLDVALIPVGGWGLTLGPGHLDPARAAEALTLLRPRAAVPVHWGSLHIPVLWRTRPDRSTLPGDTFAGHAAELAPDTRVVVLQPGHSYDVPRADAS
jgi:L-ascorbate metabolism protein UlaG (beta-lactamase superfamily)